MTKIAALIIVNLITAIRIIGVFCLLPIYLKLGGIAAAILSIGCYLTDCIDGIIARKCRVSTFFGSVFDGIADKAFSVANLILLFTITKFAIFPILCEIAIITVQTIKFQKNVNVKSSFAGKVKTWIVSITVILLYLIIDIENITFLSPNFINYVQGLNQFYLLGCMFIPLYIFEILTLVSYLKFIKNYDPKEIKVEVKEINIKLKKPKNFKDKVDNFCTLWLNNDFYEKYKDAGGLKEIREFVKNNR